MSRKIISLILNFCFLVTQTGFAQVASVELNLAGHLSRMQSNLMVDTFRPLHLRYFSYDLSNNTFKVLLDKGDAFRYEHPSSIVPRNQEELQSEVKQLMQYFLIGVSLPNDTFWVNLRPDSSDQIIDNQLALTDVGKVMLETDLQLKKDTAMMTSPQTPEGKEYWNKLYKKAEELYGSENVTIPTLTRPWIVPGEIIVRETKDERRRTTEEWQGTQASPSAYIYKATLKVLLEEDYLRGTKDVGRGSIDEGGRTKSSIIPHPSSFVTADYSFKDERSRMLNEYSTQLIRELIIPKLTKEVNTSKKYAALRQVYYSLILSRWFKERFKDAQGLSPTKANPENIKGTVPDFISLIDSKDLTNLTSKTNWSKDTYFNAYKKSFTDGEYNIKQPVYTPTGQVIRSYMSGGIGWTGSSAITPKNVFTTANQFLPNAINNFLTPVFGNAEGILEIGQTSTSPIKPITAGEIYTWEKFPEFRVEILRDLMDGRLSEIRIIAPSAILKEGSIVCLIHTKILERILDKLYKLQDEIPTRGEEAVRNDFERQFKEIIANSSRIEKDAQQEKTGSGSADEQGAASPVGLNEGRGSAASPVTQQAKIKEIDRVIQDIPAYSKVLDKWYDRILNYLAPQRYLVKTNYRDNLEYIRNRWHELKSNFDNGVYMDSEQSRALTEFLDEAVQRLKETKELFEETFGPHLREESYYYSGYRNTARIISRLQKIRTETESSISGSKSAVGGKSQEDGAATSTRPAVGGTRSVPAPTGNEGAGSPAGQPKTTSSAVEDEISDKIKKVIPPGYLPTYLEYYAKETEVIIANILSVFRNLTQEPKLNDLLKKLAQVRAINRLNEELDIPERWDIVSGQTHKVGTVASSAVESVDSQESIVNSKNTFTIDHRPSAIDPEKASSAVTLNEIQEQIELLALQFDEIADAKPGMLKMYRDFSDTKGYPANNMAQSADNLLKRVKKIADSAHRIAVLQTWIEAQVAILNMIKVRLTNTLKGTDFPEILQEYENLKSLSKKLKASSAVGRLTPEQLRGKLKSIEGAFGKGRPPQGLMAAKKYIHHTFLQGLNPEDTKVINSVIKYHFPYPLQGKYITVDWDGFDKIVRPATVQTTVSAKEDDKKLVFESPTQLLTDIELLAIIYQTADYFRPGWQFNKQYLDYFEALPQQASGYIQVPASKKGSLRVTIRWRKVRELEERIIARVGTSENVLEDSEKLNRWRADRLTERTPEGRLTDFVRPEVRHQLKVSVNLLKLKQVMSEVRTRVELPQVKKPQPVKQRPQIDEDYYIPRIRPSAPSFSPQRMPQQAPTPQQPVIQATTQKERAINPQWQAPDVDPLLQEWIEELPVDLREDLDTFLEYDLKQLLKHEDKSIAKIRALETFVQFREKKYDFYRNHLGIVAIRSRRKETLARISKEVYEYILSKDLSFRGRLQKVIYADYADGDFPYARVATFIYYKALKKLDDSRQYTIDGEGRIVFMKSAIDDRQLIQMTAERVLTVFSNELWERRLGGFDKFALRRIRIKCDKMGHGDKDAILETKLDIDKVKATLKEVVKRELGERQDLAKDVLGLFVINYSGWDFDKEGHITIALKKYPIEPPPSREQLEQINAQVGEDTINVYMTAKAAELYRTKAGTTNLPRDYPIYMRAYGDFDKTDPFLKQRGLIKALEKIGIDYYDHPEGFVYADVVKKEPISYTSVLNNRNIKLNEDVVRWIDSLPDRLKKKLEEFYPIELALVKQEIGGEDVSSKWRVNPETVAYFRALNKLNELEKLGKEFIYSNDDKIAFKPRTDDCASPLTEGYILNTLSSSAMPGGIDFKDKAMSSATTYETFGSFAGLDFSLPSLSASAIASFDLDKESESISSAIDGGIIISGQRIKEYIAASAAKGEFEQRRDTVIVWLAKLGILEESRCCTEESSKDYREALVIAETFKAI